MVNVNIFEYADSRWQDIFLHLQKAGFDVYPPAIKTGECLAEYVVVKNDGSSRLAGLSTDDDFYAVMCYVPMKSYSTLEPFVQSLNTIIIIAWSLTTIR